jgi:hypothetical protein
MDVPMDEDAQAHEDGREEGGFDLEVGSSLRGLSISLI